MNLLPENRPEVWGGIECTINRVGDCYFDQLEYSGHRTRPDDIALFTSLGIKKIRYPVLWEHHQPILDESCNWTGTTENLNSLHESGVDVIAGLVHHGSGPSFVNIMDGSFVDGLEIYASKVAGQFPWIEYYTPINELVTTARFCGLYGIWFPHQTNENSFCRILVNECMATVRAMQAIRKINPAAKLVQTDDLLKVHSTRELNYQAVFENERRWLGFDLISGKVDSSHTLYEYLTSHGIESNELEYFVDNPCPPDIMGLNYYITSERFLDHRKASYPEHTYGTNGIHTYADVEAVRVGHIAPDGPTKLIREAWERYQMPVAITEVHLHCTREEQMRWLDYMWTSVSTLREEGIDLLAITAWALLGSFGWNNLLTQPKGLYESGIFDLNEKTPRPTILAKMLLAYAARKPFLNPVLSSPGWWQRSDRVVYGREGVFENSNEHLLNEPIYIHGIHASLLGKVCEIRRLNYQIICSDFKIFSSIVIAANENIEFSVAGKETLMICLGDDSSLREKLNKALDLFQDEEIGVWIFGVENTLIQKAELVKAVIDNGAISVV